MEKKNIYFENILNGVSMRYELLPTDEFDEAAYDKLKTGRLDMVAPIQFSAENARRVIYSQIPSSVQLTTFLKKTLSKAEVLTILKNIIKGLDIGKNNIPVGYIVRDMSYVYISESTLNAYLFAIPVKGQSAGVSENADFMRTVVSSM